MKTETMSELNKEGKEEGSNVNKQLNHVTRK
jgi:hypothetical protein